MDIAALSVINANHQLRADAHLSVLGNVKNMMEQQGNQFVEMLQDSTTTAVKVPHPSLGNKIDVQA